MTENFKQAMLFIAIALIMTGAAITFIVNRYNKYNHNPGQDDSIDYKFRSAGVGMLVIGNSIIITYVM